MNTTTQQQNNQVRQQLWIDTVKVIAANDPYNASNCADEILERFDRKFNSDTKTTTQDQ